MKLAPNTFPDPAQLQPVPANTKPNVSGNVNTATENGQVQNIQGQDQGSIGNDSAQTTQTQGTTPATNPELFAQQNPKGSNLWISVIVIGLAMGAIILWRFVKRRG
jgi:hypothetical protein